MDVLFIALLIGLVAMLYSSVGHGGASGYLAVLGFTLLSKEAISSTALLLNLVVAGTAFMLFRHARYFHRRLLWPFLVGSIPMAFIGGSFKISDRTYFVLLAAVLMFAAWRMIMRDHRASDYYVNPPPVGQAVAFGAMIGLLSGIVGVGGGIFLSPIFILMRWAGAKETATASAGFIFANSLAGLGGRVVSGQFEVGYAWPFLIAALIGGLLGSLSGVKLLAPLGLRRVLGLVLAVAAVKMLLRD